MPRVPAWVTDGWYSNNAYAQQLAIARYRLPVTTAAERMQAKTFTPDGGTYGCSECGRYAFARPTICYWCRRA